MANAVLDPAEKTRLSKLIAYVLRHGAAKEKLSLRDDGYLKVTDLLARPKFKGVTFEQIQYVVDTNDKQRYKLLQEDGEWWIRANQGHSLKVKVEMDPINDASNVVAVHGTSLEAWEHIKQSGGLKRMNRNHIHLAPGLPSEGKVISGMRATSQVYIFINLDKALKDGIPFYRSSNQVILTEGVNGFLSIDYFESVQDRHGQRIL
ncbi:phosphotransferase KptA/Tpt1 [Syncephalastrum racemosum]|uniref:2'-phosphotransferase n=1 Tax=Syncephalastrum racemosum TaxID=13706 RepID=A0A1X2H4N9_SYNRA|nr:phosphotransferase KptA/Tpt1 [Syncephalastrum racemosum]